jgi:hypothetical protein
VAVVVSEVVGSVAVADSVGSVAAASVAVAQVGAGKRDWRITIEQ